jgi:rubrerythrin
MIRFVGDSDPTTRRLLEKILEVEEEHADDMSTLLETTIWPAAKTDESKSHPDPKKERDSYGNHLTEVTL